MRFVAPEGTTLVEPLAHGAIFHVALVRERDVTLVCKRLLPRVRSEPAARAAMAREGLALSRARHPALPALHRVGADAHGPFIIEEHVAGVSVRGLIEGWRARGRRVPPRLVAHVAAAAAEALAEVHALDMGLSHGDLGPDHVIMSPIGAARFVDLGAARFTGMDPVLETADRGTLPFVAPEVARGEAPPGQAADAYALAATILFLATAGEPLTASRDEAAMLLEIGDRGLPLERCDQVEGFSPRARDALRRALARDPAARLQGARALAEALVL